MAPTVVLISGANRGIGRALCERYLARPDHIVVAANRDPEHASSKSLADLARGSGTQLIVVKVDATNETEAFVAVKDLQRQGIDHIDLVIANAGVAYVFDPVSTIDLKAVASHVDANGYGIVRLYQATVPLLLNSPNSKWATMGSVAGSIEKAVAHWFTKRMNGEQEKLTAFVVTPGWVPTDMGNSGAQALGMEQAPDSLDDSCDGMVKLFDEATKETHGGRLWYWYGEQESW